MAEMVLTKEAVTGHASGATTVQCLPPGLSKAAVISGRMVVRSVAGASASVGKVLNVQRGTGSSAVTVLSFTMPTAVAANTIVNGVLASTDPVTIFTNGTAALGAVNLVWPVSTASTAGDLHLTFDDKGILKP